MARDTLAEALAEAHRLEGAARAARRVGERGAPSTAAARARVRVALGQELAAGGWSGRRLAQALGVRGLGGGIMAWRRGDRLPPPWLTLALAALDAGDIAGEPLSPEALRDRMAEGGWTPAGLAAALGETPAAVAAWRIGQPPMLLPALVLALAETERRTPLDARGIVADGARLEPLARALAEAHRLDRERQAARYHGAPAARLEAAIAAGAGARARLAGAVRAMLDTDGWSDRQLQSVLGTRGETVVANWWRGKRLPPAWLALALSALDAGDVVGEPLTPETLRDRMAEQGWGPAGLAAALGVARAAITRWQSGRTSPAAGVTLALAEAERRTPLDARHISGPAVRPADR